MGWEEQRSGQGRRGFEGSSGVHSDHFLPLTPTKLQLPPPGPLPGSTISCWPPRRGCWPLPPIGLSPVRTCIPEPQVLLESQGPDQHHTLSPISRLTGLRGACTSKLGWVSCPPLLCAWDLARTLSDGGCPVDRVLLPWTALPPASPLQRHCPLPRRAVKMEAQRERLPSQNHSKAGTVPGLEPDLLHPSLSPSALGVTPPNPAFPLPDPQH